MQPVEARITDLAAPVAEDMGYELVRVRLTGSKEKTVQVMAERPDGTFSIDDCTALSRALSALFDVEDPVDGAYRLEVSSPGIDRPLTRLKDFDRWSGFEAKLELDRMVEGRKRFRGRLVGVEDENIEIDLEGEDDTALIPFAWIAMAKLMLTDDLVDASLKGAQGAPEMPEMKEKDMQGEEA